MDKWIAKRVLVVGWGSGDWSVCQPLLEQGLMPNLQRLIQSGASGEICCVAPLLSPPAWTSVATGKRPFKHGVHGLFEADEDIGGVRPASSESRATKAVWNILTQAGFRTHVIGWSGAHPAEAIAGANVTDQYMATRVEYEKPWPQPDRSVHPPELGQTVASMRLHPDELDRDTLSFFVPALESVTSGERGRLKACTKWLAASITTHSIATWAMENRPWDFTAVCYTGFEHLSDAYSPFMPPRRATILDREYRLFSNIVRACHQFHDLMLGRLLQLAGDDAVIILLSPFGWKSGDARPPHLKSAPEDLESRRRSRGMVVLRGEYVQPGSTVDQASVLDLAPTVLAAFGLPVGADMDGRPLPQMFGVGRATDKIESWDLVNGDCHAPSATSDRRRGQLQSMITQLVALGYRDPQEEALAAEQDRTLKRNKFNLARSLMEAGRIDQAAETLNELTASPNPALPVFALLIEAQLALGAYDEAHAVVERLQARSGSQSLVELSLGRIALGLGDLTAAVQHLRSARKVSPNDPRVWFFLGRTNLLLGDPAKARRAFERVVELDPDHVDAREALQRLSTY